MLNQFVKWKLNSYSTKPPLVAVMRYCNSTTLWLHTLYTLINFFSFFFLSRHLMLEPIVWFVLFFLLIFQSSVSWLKPSAGNVSIVLTYLESYHCCVQCPVGRFFFSAVSCVLLSLKILKNGLSLSSSCHADSCVLRTLPDNRDYSMSRNVILKNVSSVSSYKEDKWHVLIFCQL